MASLRQLMKEYNDSWTGEKEKPLASYLAQNCKTPDEMKQALEDYKCYVDVDELIMMAREEHLDEAELLKQGTILTSQKASTVALENEKFIRNLKYSGLSDTQREVLTTIHSLAYQGKHEAKLKYDIWDCFSGMPNEEPEDVKIWLEKYGYNVSITYKPKDRTVELHVKFSGIVKS